MTYQYAYLSLCLMGLTSACADAESPDVCALNPPETECQPLYAPTFSNVYSNTIETRCAVGGGACHMADGSAGTLNLGTSETAYAELIETGRIIPGDAKCSPLMLRLSPHDDRLLMPPGAPLSVSEICAIGLWIEAGASR